MFLHAVVPSTQLPRPPSLPVLFLLSSPSLSSSLSLSLSRSLFPCLSLSHCLPARTMEPNSPKKIQFAVPPLQNHLDPQAAEHIRRRRPTPATLVIYSDPSAAADDKRTTGNPGEAPGAEPAPPQVDLRDYAPPTMRELQLVMEQHLQKQEDMEAGPSVGMEPSSPVTEQYCPSIGQWTNYSNPQNNGNEGYTSSLHSAEESMESSSTAGKFHVLLLFFTIKNGSSMNLHYELEIAVHEKCIPCYIPVWYSQRKIDEEIYVV
nr:protein phosphatase 1 regulatory subunit 1C isoform X2 [Paramormyrops kingsleyae]